MTRINLLISNLAGKLYHKYVVAFVTLFSITSCLLVCSIYMSEQNLLQKYGHVYFLNVGQGDSTFIITSSGSRILIDAGNVDGRAVSEIRKILPWFDRRIDIAIGTHADIDHVGGFAKIFKNFKVGKFLLSNIHTSKAVEKSLFDEINRAGISTSTISRGAIISFSNPNDNIKVLYPEHRVKINSDKDTNLFSIVLIATIANKRYLLTGDAPRSVELKLVEANKIIRSNNYFSNPSQFKNVCPKADNSNDLNLCSLDAEILKAGHHGSRTSTDPNFVKLVSPNYGIISAGLNNRYGHPHTETLDAFKNENVKAMRTDEIGTINF